VGQPVVAVTQELVEVSKVVVEPILVCSLQETHFEESKLDGIRGVGQDLETDEVEVQAPVSS